MTKIRLPYTVSDTDRHGNTRHYVRIKGKPKVRLPGQPGDADFMAAYHAALSSVPAKKTGRASKGSFRELCEAYYASPQFKAWDPSTRDGRRRSLDSLLEEHGNKPIALLEPKHIRKLRNDRAEKPGAANSLVKALKSLFAWGIEEFDLTRNPARDVKALKYGREGYHSWTLEEIEKFKARHPLGSKPRLAMALMLYTTGRREDAVRLGQKHMQAGRLRFVQAKNEHRKPITVDIPVHPDLAAAIKAMPLVGSETFLVTDYGKPFTPGGFGHRFRNWCNQAGLRHCSAHGLRKAMATRLAEHGATAHEIMSITGHQTLEEVERYTRAAERAGLADRAMGKVTKQEDER